MTTTVVLPVVIGGLYAAGVYLLLDRSLTRVLLGFLLLGNATNLLLLSAGGPAGLAPILGVAEPAEMSDPLPQAFALTAEVTHVGRGMAADLRLDDHTVSARHAILVARADRLRILDDRSTNGTVVNGRRIDEAELHDGDVVVLGRVVLTYRVV